MIGRIYRLVGGNKYYYGSTFQTLMSRMSAHKSNAKNRPQPCHKHFNEVGWDKVRIELVKEAEFKNPTELRKLENDYILLHKDDENCLNSISSYVSVDEIKQNLRNYLAESKCSENYRNKIQAQLNMTDEEFRADSNRRQREFRAAQKLRERKVDAQKLREAKASLPPTQQAEPAGLPSPQSFQAPS